MTGRAEEMKQILLDPAPLTHHAFEPFGEVIEAQEDRAHLINGGLATRYHDLATVDVLEAGGRPLINIFRGRPWPLPIRVTIMERHPLATQAFMPLTDQPFLVIVAPPGETPRPEDLRAFLTSGRQGVSYRRGVWHHPLLVLGPEADFLVVDRGGGDNCDEVHFDGALYRIVVAPVVAPGGGSDHRAGG